MIRLFFSLNQLDKIKYLVLLKEIQIKSNLKLIGGGGNSKVHECCIIDYSEENIVIIKVGCNTKTNIANYNLIKSLDLPTLEFVDEGTYNNRSTLITEHLNINSEEMIYVSPNSVITEMHRKIKQLNLFENQNELIESIAENYRYENKLNEIENLYEFIFNTVSDLRRISSSKVIVEYDSYFVGSMKDSNVSEINYKIADFDNIYECKDWSFQKCFETNKVEFERMLLGYITHFVSDGQNKEDYKSIINEIKNIV